MKGAYGSVPEPARLLLRERDAVSGRRTGGRDEKGRRRVQESHPPRWPVSRVLVAVGLAAMPLALLGFVVATRGAGDGEDVATPNVTETPDRDPGPPVTTPPTDPPATAIALSYSGGTLSRRVCTNLEGGPCETSSSDFDPLAVRCTAQRCTVDDFGEVAVPLVPGLSRSGTLLNTRFPECPPLFWTLTLEPVGRAVTRGIGHPARLVGTAATVTVPSSTPGSNCLGAEEEYTYDAVPS